MMTRFVIACMVVLMLAVVTVLFARRLRRYSRLRWWANMLIPGMQVVIMSFLLVCFIMNDVPTWFYALVVASGGLCAAGDVVLVKALNASEEKDLVEERERVLSEQMELQVEHLARLEADASDARHAKADIAGRLERVARALDELEAVEAGEAPEDVVANVRRQMRNASAWVRVRPSSCGHPVVDALLDSKLELCAQQDIRTELALQVPYDLAVQNVDLCAVFSNVMDNAIAACAQVTPASRRFITMKARVAGGFFMLEVSNSCRSAAEEIADAKAAVGEPAKADAAGELASAGDSASASGPAGADECAPSRPAPDPRAPFREHGWGTIILGAIAERYDGTFEAKRTGREFRTLVALKVAS
ncbi:MULTISPECIES: GHKL domain-containing protein [unclassified Adlercreutzia]|uniref:GHKL domain-containing protein n=1 Tax=unclassified Adlercreutzia TaxID=2636013 RepID=UPI0013EE36D7|nr:MULTISPECIES: GHKL domain-containing protein [unclassified Adlercreutzia]